MTSPAGRSVVVARFPAQSTALHLHLGSEDPPGGLSEVPPDASNAVATTNAEASLLVAGFNGGFKADAGAGGVEADGTTVRPLIPGVASALIDVRGLLTIGAWGAVSLPTGDRLVSVRQNLSLLVDGGRPTATALSGPGPWGSVLGPDPVVARSALGVDAEGNAYFAGSMHVLPADLAQVLSSIGVVRAMQLDMNPYWVTLGTTPTPGGILAARDADYGAMTWLPDSGGLKHWLALYEACGRAVGGEPDAGRHLARWAADAGFSDVTSTASTWVYETREERAWWGSLWAERVTSSAFAEVALSRGLADEAELEGLADAWRSFGSAPQGRFVVPHGEILCRVD